MFYVFLISNNMQGFLFSNFLFGEELDFFGLLKVKIQSNFDYDKALKQCLNFKNLIHVSETAMI